MKQIILAILITTCTVLSKGQNVGIGTTTPGFPLNFSNALGDKISLYGNSGNHYGFGIQGGLMQIHSDGVGSNIAFGYGSSSSFTERMRILNNGSYDGMSLNGRLVLKNGSTDLVGGGAGVWLYKADNTALLGFMGTQNNQNIGFYGGPGGWGFTYDAVNSRVGINNNNPANRLSVVGNADITGNVGIGTANPANRLDVTGLNNWDLTNTEGDMRIGNSSYRIKFGIALSGGGAGAAGLMQTGGVGTLNLGANNKNLIQLNGAGNYVDFTNITGGLRINGSAGSAGQVLQSNDNGAAPGWKTKPYFSWVIQSGNFEQTYTELIGSGVTTAFVPGMDNESIFIPEPSRVMASISAYLIPIALTDIASGKFVIEIWESSTNTLKLRLNASGYANGYDGATLSKMDLVDLNAGFHLIRAYHQRWHDTFSGNSRLYQKKLILQIFPN